MGNRDLWWDLSEFQGIASKLFGSDWIDNQKTQKYISNFDYG